MRWPSDRAGGGRLIVADASPLIALSRIDRLGLLKSTYRRVSIGPRVREETVERGLEVDPVGSRRVAEAMRAGWLEEVQPSVEEEAHIDLLVLESGLGAGEAEALALAASRGASVIIDDKAARIAAEALGVRYLGTVGAVLEAALGGHLGLEELEQSIRDLTDVLWLSPAVVAEVLRRARELR